jgi:hypothetical protein
MKCLLKNENNEVNVESAPSFALNPTHYIHSKGEHSKGETMKLQYRGVSYEYDSSKLESQNRSQRFKQVRGSGPAYNLIYRGVTYRIDPNTKMTRVFNSDPAFRWMYPKPHQYLTNFLHFGLSIRW